MAGELKAAQIAANPVTIETLNSGSSGPGSTITYMTYHVIAAGATGNPDDVTVINAALPVRSSLRFAILNATAGAGGATAWVTDGIGTVLETSSHIATGAMDSASTGIYTTVLAKNSTIKLHRSNDNIGGVLVLFWDVYQNSPAGRVKPGQVAPASMTAASHGNAPSTTIGVPFNSVHIMAAGGGGAGDVTLENANFPRKAILLYAAYRATTLKAGSMTLRSAAGGGGDALSAAIDTNTAAINVFATGTGTALAAGGSLFARRTDNTCAGELTCWWLPRP